MPTEKFTSPENQMWDRRSTGQKRKTPDFDRKQREAKDLSETPREKRYRRTSAEGRQALENLKARRMRATDELGKAFYTINSSSKEINNLTQESLQAGHNALQRVLSTRATPKDIEQLEKVAKDLTKIADQLLEHTDTSSTSTQAEKPNTTNDDGFSNQPLKPQKEELARKIAEHTDRWVKNTQLEVWVLTANQQAEVDAHPELEPLFEAYNAAFDHYNAIIANADENTHAAINEYKRQLRRADRADRHYNTARTNADNARNAYREASDNVVNDSFSADRIADADARAAERAAVRTAAREVERLYRHYNTLRTEANRLEAIAQDRNTRVEGAFTVLNDLNPELVQAQQTLDEASDALVYAQGGLPLD